MKLSDTNPGPPKILLWGPSGCGKSALAYTLGELAQVFDFDRGWETGRTLVDEFQPMRKSVDITGPLDKEGQPLGYVDLIPTSPNAIQIFKTDFQATARKILEGTYPFPAIIIDNLTSMYDCAMRFAKASGATKKGNLAMSQETERLHYNLTYGDIMNVIQLLKSLPVVVICIAHDKVEVSKDANGNITSKLVHLGVGSAIRASIPNYFDESWYLHMTDEGGGKFKRKIQTQPDTMKSCKTRRQVPNMMDINIGLPKILESVGFKF